MENPRLRDRALARVAAVVLSIGLCAVSGLPWARAGLLGTAPTNELLVGFRAGTSFDDAFDALDAVGATFVDEVEGIDTFLVRVPAWSIDAISAALSALPIVEYVEPNRRVAPDATANDPYFGSQWHLPKIRATEAWDTTTGSPDVVIAILDSGVDATHPDLAAKLLPGWNFFDANGDTSDVYGHGTKVAGAAGAIGNNAIGVASVALQSYLMPVRVTDTAGYGYISSISQGITWSADHGARVINASFASLAGSSTIASASRYARSKGALVVVSAGNCGCDDPTAESPDILAVSATTAMDALASFSSRGAYVDVSAPGSAIYTTTRGGGYASVAGTSFASPVTAGTIALLMAAAPGLSPDEIQAALESTAVDLGATGHDSSFGAGRVDVAAALGAVMASPPAPRDTTAPSASITSPASGSTVTGTVAIDVMAFDDVGVAAVDLVRDGVTVATDSTAPFSFSWNTTTSTNGGHSLGAVARDAAGNRGTSSASVVTVANTSPTPTPTSTPAPTATPKTKKSGGGGRRWR